VITQSGFLWFSFSCIGAGLPKTEANWHDVISDLKRIEDLIQVSTHFSIKWLRKLL
jgi:hypothetical protein